uniref:Protein xylosyltransferase n=1 Tax=Eutreptiella gymnastica TaxID=73025 RepID=A0A7S1I723_9EUGL|mmetsp:Transcript_134160/g.232924  ORF Transcript_134160/g.232924 Transcript_134160/m.232924 type:complete len:421 (+) Transcript_134160:85-1347(+)
MILMWLQPLCRVASELSAFVHRTTLLLLLACLLVVQQRPHIGVAFAGADSSNAGAASGQHKWATILLTGQARTFNSTICSFQANIIVPLQQMGYRVNIFAVAPDDETGKQIQTLSLLPKDVMTKIYYTQTIDFPAECTNYTMEHYHQPSLHWWGKKRYTYVFLEQVYLKFKAEQLRKLYEQQAGISSDWVIWLRPDVLYVDPIPWLDELDPNAVWIPKWGGDYRGINDRAMIARGGLSSAYLDLYKGLCIDNLEFPHNFQSERLHRWFLRSGPVLANPPKEPVAIGFLENFRFLRLRIGQHLPVEKETPDYFNPAVRKCKNYLAIKEGWYVRTLQLQCVDTETLKPVSTMPLQVPPCIIPYNGSRGLTIDEFSVEMTLGAEEHTWSRWQNQPIKQAPKMNPIKRLARNARVEAIREKGKK